MLCWRRLDLTNPRLTLSQYPHRDLWQRSGETQALVQQLLRERARPERTWWQRWRGEEDVKQASIAGIVARLGQQGEPDVLPVLLSALAEGPQVAQAVAVAAERLLAQVPIGAFPRLDERMRRPYVFGTRNREQERAQLHTLAGSVHPSRAVLALVSMSQSGFAREAAVQLLTTEGAWALPFMLLRVNDWVRPVREAALKTVRESLHPDYAAAFASALPLVLRLPRLGRHNAGGLADEVFDLLARTETGLVTAIQHADRDVRHAIAKRIVSYRGVAFEQSVLVGLEDSDPVVRLRMAKAAMARPKLFGPALARKLQADPFTPVRQLGIGLEAEQSGGTAVLQRALFDPAWAIRVRAQFELGKTEEADIAEHYRKALSESVIEGRRLRAALAGLAETGRTGDAALAAPWLDDASARTRLRALRTAASLDPETYQRAITRALHDASPRVSRFAASALANRRAELDPAALVALATAEDAPDHARKHAVGLLAILPHWAALVPLLQVAAKAEGGLLDETRRLLGVWTWRSECRVYTSPTAEERAEIERALERAPLSDAMRVRIAAVVEKRAR